jgi:Fis family transcriptional regulator
MSKESIQEVIQKSLEEYFNDLGEQQASNIYDMVVLTVEKPILEVVMLRAEGNQSHAAQMLGINRNCARSCKNTGCCKAPAPTMGRGRSRPLRQNTESSSTGPLP